MLGSEECFKEMFSFLVETMETAVKSWHEASKVDPRVYFLLDKEKTQTDKYAPVVNIDKVFTFETVLSSLETSFSDVSYMYL
jgi:Ni,Fe-hydrogenase I cytochrome b subunit